MPRIPLVTPDSLTAEQRRVYDTVVAGPRGAVVGPLRAALHSPELADRWQQLGEFLRYRASVPPRQRELAIVVTGRRWTSQIEWHVHAKAAREAGVPEGVLEAIRHGRTPEFDDPDDALVYEYTCELQQRGAVSDATYRRGHASWGTCGIVELTAIIGYYTMVCMTLNAHEIPLPDGVEPPLGAPSREAEPPDGNAESLAYLPPGRLVVTLEA